VLAGLGLLAAAVLILAQASSALGAQTGTTQTVARDSASAASAVAFGSALSLMRLTTPGPMFGAGKLHRSLLGKNYRDLWTTSIRVPELNLKTFAGGIKPTKVGGGMATKSLRFATEDGLEYAFREVKKDHSWSYAEQYRGSFVEWLSRDQRSTAHPAGALAAASLLAAVGVLHPTPTLVFMPEEADLGEYAAEFGGQLGLLVEFQKRPKKGAGLAGASKIIDSEELLALLNADPSEQIDAAAMLAARLVDILVGDWDRHPGQWKWARFKSDSATAATPWVPISRDRDMTFATYEGLFGKLAGFVSGISKAYDGEINVKGLTQNAIAMDRRLLGGLSRRSWDSVTRVVVQRLTDSAIDSAVMALPDEIRTSERRLAVTLKQRREALSAASDRYYAQIFGWVDLHATDKSEIATITRVDDQFVDVRLSAPKVGDYFVRRYDRRETKEIRLYLHGGDDSAAVRGLVSASIPVRLIGGGGNNALVDSAVVAGRRGSALLYDRGASPVEVYPEDTLFNRCPPMKEFGTLRDATRDFGVKIVPVFGFSDPRGLGIVPRIGVSRLVYGFRRKPYASRATIQAEYAFPTAGLRVGAEYDRRMEQSPMHLTVAARMSELEVINYFGLGNATVDAGPQSDFYRARQRQWSVRPTVGFALNSASDISIGPIVQYSTTDATAGRFLSVAQPYGVGTFRQAGAQLLLHHDFRDGDVESRNRIEYDITGSAFPALLDVKRPFSKVTAWIVASCPFGIPLQPVFAVRAGGKKIWGEFPYHEAAFIGGERTLRYMTAQRYAGDAAVYATAELRLRAASFSWVPVAFGVVGVAEAGRVYVGGKSPEGWHSVTGGGLWLGVKESPSVLTFLVTTERGRPGVHIKLGLGY